MTDRRFEIIRRLIAAVALVVLIAGLGMLLVDHLRWQAAYDVGRDSLRQAEAAAQQDATATEPLERLVDEQTAISIQLKRRERVV
ncbi:MAG: hypothetical protein KDA60_04640, partial [Planctomycetales bacterium]|nr:hypothetical protein [Planctomycetales bacterium]